MPMVKKTRKIKRPLVERLFSLSWFTKYREEEYLEWEPPSIFNNPPPVRPLKQPTSNVLTHPDTTDRVVAENSSSDDFVRLEVRKQLNNFSMLRKRKESRMKHKQSVKPEKLGKYEKADINGVKFEITDSYIKAIFLETSAGPLEVRLESYSICAYEAVTHKVFRATVSDTTEYFPELVKDFESEYERQNWLDGLDTEHGRFVAALSVFEELSE